MPEVWLRGPLPGIHPLLQPVAHALLQSREEVLRYTAGFPDHLLWVKPGGAASAGFHLQHIKGVLDRLFTYAEGNALTPDQLGYLAAEGVSAEGISVDILAQAVVQQIDKSVEFLKNTDPAVLTEARSVGRQALPSTVLGLLFHAAEHTQRHIGQLYVTVKVVQIR
ncbi:MAG: metal-dependent hydrolase [Cytophagaceae bacterium SCN 52-12]|nr:MAG: metal-dependent hydrolase [Cytophagaceae bacterium SCN 52-12]